MAKKSEKSAYIDPKEEPISVSSINRFDIYSLKGALDDEIISVRTSYFVLTFLSGSRATHLWSTQTTSMSKLSFTP